MRRYALSTLNKQVETVILANGNFPSHDIPLSILDRCKHLVACDGATNELVETGRIPHAIVGDRDSLSEENEKRFASIMHHIEEQDTNDQTKAVNYCVSEGWKDITILGATGKREDHTIGNISLLCEYIKIANVQMITDCGIFVAIDSDSIFESFKEQQVSLFCFDPKPISTQGLVYEIKDKIFDRWWQGTLNESEGEEFIVKTEGIVIVYREFGNF